MPHGKRLNLLFLNGQASNMEPITINYDDVKSLASEPRLIADQPALGGGRKRIVQRPFLGKYQVTLGDGIPFITGNLRDAVERFNKL